MSWGGGILRAPGFGGIRLTEDNLGRHRGLRCIEVKEGDQIVHDILDEGTAEADEGNTHDDGGKGKPSVG